MDPAETSPTTLDKRPPSLEALLGQARAYSSELLRAGVASTIEHDLEGAALEHGAHVLTAESPTFTGTAFGSLVRSALDLGVVRLRSSMADADVADLEKQARAFSAVVLTRDADVRGGVHGALVNAGFALGAARLLGTFGAEHVGALETAARNYCAGTYEARIRTLELSLETERRTLRAQIDGLIAERSRLEAELTASSSVPVARAEAAETECVRLREYLARAQAALVQTRAEMAGTFGKLAHEIANLEKAGAGIDVAA